MLGMSEPHPDAYTGSAIFQYNYTSDARPYSKYRSYLRVVGGSGLALTHAYSRIGPS